MTLLIVLGSVLAYLLIGLAAAKWNLRRSWEIARQEWFTESIQRDAVRAGFVTMLLLWPIRLPARYLSDLVDQAIDQGDPKRLERELRERDGRIKELERELGMR